MDYSRIEDYILNGAGIDVNNYGQREYIAPQKEDKVELYDYLLFVAITHYHKNLKEIIHNKYVKELIPEDFLSNVKTFEEAKVKINELKEELSKHKYYNTADKFEENYLNLFNRVEAHLASSMWGGGEHFFSHKLNGNKFDCVSRLYIPCDSECCYKFARLMLEKSVELGREFEFKIMNVADKENGADNIVVYLQEKELVKTVNMINEIISENPDITFGKIHMFGYKVNDYIAAAPELSSANSYSGIIRDELEKYIEEYGRTKECAQTIYKDVKDMFQREGFDRIDNYIKNGDIKQPTKIEKNNKEPLYEIFNLQPEEIDSYVNLRICELDEKDEYKKIVDYISIEDDGIIFSGWKNMETRYLPFDVGDNGFKVDKKFIKDFITFLKDNYGNISKDKLKKILTEEKLVEICNLYIIQYFGIGSNNEELKKKYENESINLSDLKGLKVSSSLEKSAGLNSILNFLGIDSSLVTSKVNDEAHAYCLIKKDEKYKIVDPSYIKKSTEGKAIQYIFEIDPNSNNITFDPSKYGKLKNPVKINYNFPSKYLTETKEEPGKYNYGFPVSITNFSEEEKKAAIKDFAEGSPLLEECLSTIINDLGTETAACCRGFHEIEDPKKFIEDYLFLNKLDFLAFSRCLCAPYISFKETNDEKIYSRLSNELINNPNVELNDKSIFFYGENWEQTMTQFLEDIKGEKKDNQDALVEKIGKKLSTEAYYDSYVYSFKKNGFSADDIDIFKVNFLLNACMHSNVFEEEKVHDFCTKYQINEESEKAILSKLKEIEPDFKGTKK